MRRQVLGLALAFAPLLAGCGDDATTAVPDASVAGTYALRTVNGEALPIVVAQSGDDMIEVTGETIAIEESGRFTLEGSVRITEGGEVSTDGYGDVGTWTRSGNAIRLRFDSDGVTELATVDAGTMTIALPGISLVYRQ